MGKIIKFNFIYFLSKKNIIILSLINLTFFIILSVISNLFIEAEVLDLKRSKYMMNYTNHFIEWIKLFGVLISSFGAMFFFLASNQKYYVYFVKDIKTKKKYFFSKCLCNFLFVSYEFVILILEYIIIGKLTCYFNFNQKTLSIIMKLYIFFLYFSCLSSVLTLLFPTPFVTILDIIIYWLTEIFFSDLVDIVGTKKEIASYLIPIIYNYLDDYFFIYSFFHYLVIIVILNMLLFIIHEKNDLY